MLRSQITLQEAGEKMYGEEIEISPDLAAEWALFTPFRLPRENKVIYMKLEQEPTYYHTSPEIQQNVGKRYQQILHPVSIHLLDRTFQSSLYALITDTNVISIRGFVRFKRDCQEEVDIKLILDLLDFLLAVKHHKHVQNINFNIDTIGIQTNQKWKIIDYGLYFMKREVKLQSYSRSVKRILLYLISLGEVEQYDDDEIFYQTLLEKFGEEVVDVVKYLVGTEDFSQQKWEQMLLEVYERQHRDLDVKTTLTESFIDKIQRQYEQYTDDVQEVAVDSSRFSSNILSEDFSKIRQQKSPGKKKIWLLVVIFLLLLLTIGLITYFQFRKGENTQCQEGQFFDEALHRCRDCSFGCLKCNNDAENACQWCMGSLYLIIRDYQDKTGTCSFTCEGTLIRANLCVDPHFT